eukprot:sb/3478321/
MSIFHPHDHFHYLQLHSCVRNHIRRTNQQKFRVSHKDTSTTEDTAFCGLESFLLPAAISNWPPSGRLIPPKDPAQFYSVLMADLLTNSEWAKVGFNSAEEE